MNTIEFNRRYSKLKNLKSGTVVTLLNYNVIDKENLPKSFIKYDTDGEYKLNENYYIVLVLFHHKIGVFTTMRKNTAENRLKYFGIPGEKFKIKIEEPCQTT